MSSKSFSSTTRQARSVASLLVRTVSTKQPRKCSSMPTEESTPPRGHHAYYCAICDTHSSDALPATKKSVLIPGHPWALVGEAREGVRRGVYADEASAREALEKASQPPYVPSFSSTFLDSTFLYDSDVGVACGSCASANSYRRTNVHMFPPVVTRVHARGKLLPKL